MKQKHRLIFFSILSLLVLWFIFGNSLQGGEVSNAKSSGVAAFLRPLFDPFGRISDEIFHYLIRKLAHFTEFAALGLCLTGVTHNIPLTGKKRLWLPALISFTAAVTDETIQRFTGRTSALKDVLIDTSGALFGIAFAVLTIWAWHKIKREK